MIRAIPLASRAPEPLAALRARRTARRSEGIDAFDAFYKVYITALVVGIVLVYAADAIGDTSVSTSAADAVRGEGAAVLGLLTSFAVAVGLRSGSRGGPLALERPEIHHVLLAPVDRRLVLIGPARRQVQFLTFSAAVAGGTAGVFAASRLPGSVAGWAAWGAVWAALSVLAAVAVAWLASGLRLRPWSATVLAAVVIGAGAADVARATGATDVPGWVRHLPAGLFGEIGTFPLADHDLIWVPVAGVVVGIVAATAMVGRGSIERLEQRSRLIGEMRFAATMRDLRTVIVLRRQLSQERPRTRPWIGRSPSTRRRASGGPTTAILRRGWRSLMRTPVSRAVRMAGCTAGATVAGVGVYRGTTALVVVAGLCAFVVGLDATESLAEELDRSPIVSLSPVNRGRVLVRHLFVPTVVVALVAVVTVTILDGVWLGTADATVARAVALPAALAAVAGATVSIVRNDSLIGNPGDQESMVLPEVAGMGVVYQTVLPPAIATLGFVPLVAARSATGDTDPVAAASGTATLVVVVVALVVAWVRYRHEFQAWTNEAREQAGLRRPATSNAGDHDDD